MNKLDEMLDNRTWLQIPGFEPFINNLIMGFIAFYKIYRSWKLDLFTQKIIEIDSFSQLGIQNIANYLFIYCEYLVHWAAL